MIRKSSFATVLIILCLGTSLFLVRNTVSQSAREYDPWYDVNDDGKIDVKDIYRLSMRYGTSGTNITKASVEYDSGWIDISDKCGQYFDITHDLNSTDIMIDITGKARADGGVHQKQLGGANYVRAQGWTYGGVMDEEAYSVIQTNDGGYALAGVTGFSVSNICDFWFVKADASGNEQWNKTYGGTKDDKAYSVIQTNDGGYALAGFTNSFGAGEYDFWLIKTDSLGNMQWNKTYGGKYSDRAYSVVQTSDGGYALAGETDSYGSTGGNFWLVKTDVLGNMQWSQAYGGPTPESAFDVVQTSDGGYAIAGDVSSDPTYADFWLVKADTLGNMQWNKTFIGGSYGDIAYSVIQTSDGGYAMAGDRTNDTTSSISFWLVKTDTLGAEQWNQTYLAYDGQSFGRSVVQTSDGGYALAGSVSSYYTDGVYDFWLIKVDASGNEQWNKTYGGTSDYTAYSVVQTSDGGYALAGGTGYYKVTGGRRYDFWLVKTDAYGTAITKEWFEYGLAWTDSTPNSITLYRGTDDTNWNFVRVRIWKIKE